MGEEKGEEEEEGECLQSIVSESMDLCHFTLRVSR